MSLCGCHERADCFYLHAILLEQLEQRLDLEKILLDGLVVEYQTEILIPPTARRIAV